MISFAFLIGWYGVDIIKTIVSNLLVDCELASTHNEPYVKV